MHCMIAASLEMSDDPFLFTFVPYKIKTMEIKLELSNQYK